MASTSTGVGNWSLPEVVEYFLSDPDISSEISGDDLDHIINVKTDWVRLVRSALEYQGFDPRVILKELLRNRKAYEAQKSTTLEWDLSNVGDSLTWTKKSELKNRFSNEESLPTDVNFLITVFLARNNHIEKITKKARGGVADILSMLKEKYLIDDEVRKSGTSLDSRAVTLPRIAGVFPGTAVRMFHEMSVKEIVTYEQFPGSVKPDSHAICCPLLPSVCPEGLTQEAGGNFHPTMIWTAIKLDDIIHRKDKNTTDLLELLNYYRAGFQSAAVPERSRISIFSFLGLIVVRTSKKDSGTITLTDQARALTASCMNSLGNMRLDDENHELMMKVARNGDMTLF